MCLVVLKYHRRQLVMLDSVAIAFCCKISRNNRKQVSSASLRSKWALPSFRLQNIGSKAWYCRFVAVLLSAISRIGLHAICNFANVQEIQIVELIGKHISYVIHTTTESGVHTRGTSSPGRLRSKNRLASFLFRYHFQRHLFRSVLYQTSIQIR